MAFRTPQQRKAFFAKLGAGARRGVELGERGVVKAAEVGKREAGAMRRRMGVDIRPELSTINKRKADIRRARGEMGVFRSQIRQVAVQHRSDMKQAIAELREKISNKKLEISQATADIRAASIAIGEKRRAAAVERR